MHSTWDSLVAGFVYSFAAVSAVSANEWLIALSILGVSVRIIIDIPKAFKQLKGMFSGKSNRG